MINALKAFWYRNLLITRKSMPDLFSIVFWPVTFLLSMGLFANFVQNREVSIILLLGSIGWSYTYASQQDTSYVFVRDIWYRCIKKLRLLPISNWEIIFSNWTYGVFRSLLVFLISSSLAYYLFNFNIFGTNLILLGAFLFGINLFSLVISLFISSMVLHFGEKAEVLVWSLVDVIILISGVFYPVSILPESVQPLAFSLPLTYAFEGLRELYLKGTENYGYLLNLYAINLIYIAALWIIFSYMERRARKTGFFQKYD